MVTGVLLAAGAGRRMGRPKALLVDERGHPHLDRSVGVLFDGGCTEVVVVLGAAADDARDLLAVRDGLTVVVAPDWAQGMGRSLAAGLDSVTQGVAALIMLVDLPDVDARVIRRFVDLAGAAVLARATYDGAPGHPVLLGRDHWSKVGGTLVGDSGARSYLEAHDVHAVPCEDLASGRDLDHPEDLRPPTAGLQP